MTDRESDRRDSVTRGVFTYPPVTHVTLNGVTGVTSVTHVTHVTVKKSKGQNGAIGGFNRAAVTKRARTMLARIVPFTRWLETQQPTQDQKRLWLAIVREVMTLAALSGDEELATAMVLEVDAAIIAAAKSLN
jgi:hypothetical protein